jgi:hypothetical protein
VRACARVRGWACGAEWGRTVAAVEDLRNGGTPASARAVSGAAVGRSLAVEMQSRTDDCMLPNDGWG